MHLSLLYTCSSSSSSNSSSVLEAALFFFGGGGLFLPTDISTLSRHTILIWYYCGHDTTEMMLQEALRAWIICVGLVNL